MNLLLSCFRDTYAVMSTQQQKRPKQPRPYHQPQDHTAGFVLPYVLAVIAILAITTSIAATRLQSITRSLLALENHNRLELSFANAETEAIFALITSTDAKLAVNLSPDAKVSTDFGDLDLGTDNTSAVKTEDDFWPVNNGKRLHRSVGHTVLITLQDTKGLVSINGAPDSEIQALLQANGLTKSKSRQVSARMLDYRDGDNKRSYLGAERADYRMRKKRPPTNMPFRSHQELKQVFGWHDDTNTIDLQGLIDATTIHQHTHISAAFVPTGIAEILEIDQDENQEKAEIIDLDQIGSISNFPSNQFRLCFTSQNNNIAGSFQDRRCLEIERTANSLYAPFKKFWVYQIRVIDNDKPSQDPRFNFINKNSSKDKIKNVLHAPSFHKP